MKKSIIISIVAIIIIAGVGGFWVWKNKEKKEVEQSQTQKTVLQNIQIESVWYIIPEMNVRFKVDKEVADDLIYKYSKISDKMESVAFSSKKLSQITGCDVAAEPLGTLVKMKGNPFDYSDKDYYVSRKPKQFDNFFIIYNSPQVVCSGTGMGDDAKKLEKYFEENPKFQGWIAGSFDTIEIIDKK